MHGCGGMCMVGGVHGCGGACMVVGACTVVGGMHRCGGGVVAGGVCVGYNEIRSMSGRYASYWNAFLFMYDNVD